MLWLDKYIPQFVSPISNKLSFIVVGDTSIMTLKISNSKRIKIFKMHNGRCIPRKKVLGTRFVIILIYLQSSLVFKIKAIFKASIIHHPY